MGRSRTMSKSSFFAALESLDNSDDDQNEEALSFQNILATSRPSNKDISNKPAKVAPSIPEPPSLIRANTEPQSASSKDQRRIDERKRVDEKKTQIETEVKTVKRSNTTGTMPGNASRGSSKRKADALKIIPEAQKVFKDLIFFFVPNDDIAPARRLRIQRSREYGAQWTRHWGNHITHVIVEKKLKYQDLMDYLKLECFPADIAFVNEDYPPECIKFQSILDTTYLRFRIDGAPVSTAKINPTTSTAEQNIPDSLPLKPSRREIQSSPERTQVSPEVIQHAEAPTSEPVETVDVVEEEPLDNADIETETRERDVLDDIIDESKATSHLPLDSDDESTTGATDDESDSSDSRPARKKARTASESRTGDSWTRSFACMQKFDSHARDNPNTRTIEVLQEMLDYYTRHADQWRTIAYRKAINTLRRQKHKINTRKEAQALPCIGSRLAEKIEEIVCTNHLRRLDYTSSSSEDLLIQKFLGIYGAGLVQATRWAAQGYGSLDDLRNRAPLTTNQRIGVEHYDDFAQRIPRKEVEAHGAIIRREVQKADKDMQVIISGSYRRGARDSGDIDVLITKPGAVLDQIRCVVMQVVVPQLFEQGFLQIGLATSHRDNDGSKWHGASCLPGSKVWRRIDLLFVPGAEIGAALIYFTGNDIFNRSMRLLARKKHMCLNQHGLFGDVLRNGQNKTNPGRLLEAGDERRIFALLEVPWRRPEERIC
ncbi:hypothetical protein PENSTE_c021G07664 [Penicillium steckii]|uniref:DNA polymerase lambda n=1 Tax=Penicillium steckii TaxID=303698 RepID=A0A1V6STH6_9EURO|nr:hypothetical protein PENSTE_c021G07664 [Penicillium steckii]